MILPFERTHHDMPEEPILRALPQAAVLPFAQRQQREREALVRQFSQSVSRLEFVGGLFYGARVARTVCPSMSMPSVLLPRQHAIAIDVAAPRAAGAIHGTHVCSARRPQTDGMRAIESPQRHARRVSEHAQSSPRR